MHHGPTPTPFSTATPASTATPVATATSPTRTVAPTAPTASSATTSAATSASTAATTTSTPATTPPATPTPPSTPTASSTAPSGSTRSLAPLALASLNMVGTNSGGASDEMDRRREAGEQGGVAGGGVGTHQPANPTLPTSSTPSPITVDPVKAFSIEKFMGEDYEHWSFHMRLMYTQYKLLDLVEGKEKMAEAAELKGAWMKRSFDVYMLMSWSALANNLNSQQPQWSVGYIRARILEEDLRRRSVERSEEGAGYGVGGGKSGFKKKWKGKNQDNPQEDGGGGQGEVCFYCKKCGHRWRKCYL
ncbi:unnamed protein product [Closterium sp. NIES-65]|nr:unnamed protein product [Closterium sp. NIES-65]